MTGDLMLTKFAWLLAWNQKNLIQKTGYNRRKKEEYKKKMEEYKDMLKLKEKDSLFLETKKNIFKKTSTDCCYLLYRFH